MSCALAVHGGAWNVPDGDVGPHREGVAEALVEGWSLLQAGSSALDVVEGVVRILEDNPTFNAGLGAHLNRERQVQLDASIMEGGDLEAGAVAALQRVRHPVSLARMVLEASPHVLMVGAGATARVEAMDSMELDACLARILTATSLEELGLDR